MTKINKTTWYKFWIKSSKGTNCISYKQLPHRLSKFEIRCYLEKWCSSFTAWDISENYISYGYAKVRQPPKKWLDKYNKFRRGKKNG